MEAMWPPVDTTSGERRARAEVPVEEQRALLVQSLARHANDPEALADVVDAAIASGFSTDLDNATRRLLDLEPESLRAIRMRALVLMASMRYDEMHRLLERCPVAHADDPVLRRLADQLMAHGSERGSVPPPLTLVSDEVAPAPVPRTSGAAAAWRERADLAARILARGDYATAVEAFRRVAASDPTGEARQFAAVTLSAAEAWNELIDVVAPGYDPVIDGGAAGQHLAEAYLALGRRQDGIALVQELSQVIPAGDATALARRFARLST